MRTLCRRYLPVSRNRASTSPSAIGEGHWREYGQPAVFDYCGDVRNSAELLRRQLSGYRHSHPSTRSS